MKATPEQKFNMRRWYQLNKTQAKHKAVEWNKSNPERRKNIATKAKNKFRNKKLGLPDGQFESIIEAYPFCALCRRPFASLPISLNPVADHDHQTGKFRGALHRGCNVGIGSLRDDPAMCEMAAEYLRRTACES